MTPDICASMRGNARFMRVSKYRPALVWGKFAAKRRTQSFWRTMPARLADVPESLRDFIRSHHIRGVLCNHYFNLPIAEKIQRWAGGVKVVCETHDIQSRHMIDSNPTHPLTGAPGDYESYFRDELRCCEPADEFIHLNQEEYAVFQRELPHKTHHLIYPSLPRPPAASSTSLEVDFLIVASNNKPNYDSVRWFLDEVWDHDLNAAARLRIVGNIDAKFRADDSGYLTRFGDIFVGRVDDVASWYHRARVVLAPTIDGQGISIKTIEALSYGRPFIYSPIAVRGFSDYLESTSCRDYVRQPRNSKPRSPRGSRRGPTRRSERSTAPRWAYMKGFLRQKFIRKNFSGFFNPAADDATPRDQGDKSRLTNYAWGQWNRRRGLHPSRVFAHERDRELT